MIYTTVTFHSAGLVETIVVLLPTIWERLIGSLREERLALGP